MLKKIGNCLVANVGYNFEVASLRNILFNTLIFQITKTLQEKINKTSEKKAEVPENYLAQLAQSN